MPLVIPDETLQAAGMDEREAKLEIACRWFDAGKLAFGHAARLAGLSETEFEGQLEIRGIPRYRYGILAGTNYGGPGRMSRQGLH